MRRLENSMWVFLPRKEYLRKCWSPGRRLRPPQPQRSGRQPQRRWKGGARRTARALLGLPGETGSQSEEDTEATVVNWGAPSPPPLEFHTAKRGQGPHQQSHRERATAAQGLQPQSPRSGERLTWEVARESARSQHPVACTRPLARPFPQPAGGATGQQRGQLALYNLQTATAVQRRRRTATHRYVSRITPSGPASAQAPSPGPLSAPTRGPRPTPRTPHQPVESEAVRRDLGCNACAPHHATVSMVAWDLRCFFQQVV